MRVNYRVQLMDYVAICETANRPIIATIFRAVMTRPNGVQTGIYASVMAPGNTTSRGMIVTMWPDTVMDLAGIEANDNLFGCVWG